MAEKIASFTQDIIDVNGVKEMGAIDIGAVQDGKLTESQLDSLIDTLCMAGGDISKDIEPEVKEEEEVKPEKEILEEGLMDLSVDSETGLGTPVMTITEQDTEDTIEDFKTMFDASDEDMIKFMDIIRRYKAGEKFSIYNELPTTFKQAICNLASNQGITDRRAFNMLAKEFLVDQFISNENLNSTYNEYNNSMKEVLAEIPTMNDMYSDALKKTMTEDLHKKADLIREKDPEAADKLIKVSDVFVETYTYARLTEVILSGKYKSMVKRILKKNRFSEEMDRFNFLLSKSEFFKWPDVRSMSGVLNRVLPEEYKEYVNEFILYLYLSREGLDLNDIYEAEYVYYLIRNIIGLDVSDGTSSFNTEVIDNIKKVIDIIKTV